MLTGNKSIDYAELIKKAKERHSQADNCKLKWFDECKEINLWTYWQGFGYAEKTPDIEILVVGQDWGNPFDKPLQTIENVKKLNEEKTMGAVKPVYLSGVDLSSREAQTDKNLAKLFKTIGYEDIINNRYDELFFTNFSLGYRKGQSNTGGMTITDMLKDGELFVELCDILQPKKVICLGRITYEAVLRSFGLKYDKSIKYNDLLEKHENFTPVSRAMYETTVYGVAHCGYFGTRNRKDIPGNKNREADLSNQIGDWKSIEVERNRK